MSASPTGPAAPGASTVTLEAKPQAAPAAAAPRPAPAPLKSRLLELVIDRTGKDGAPQADRPQAWLDEFLATDSVPRAMDLWLAHMAPGKRPADAGQLSRLLALHIASIDEVLTKQVNAIIHHERFQRLESSWRGLKYLVEQVDGDHDVRVKVFNSSWADLKRHLDRAQDFEDTRLFQAIYSEEFGQPGGLPYSVLLGDYYIKNRNDGLPLNDIEALETISKVAAASFAPFISAADADLLGLPDHSQIDRPVDLSAIHNGLDYLRWRSFRDSEEARFVGLTLPRILMRRPHADDGSRADGFRFREEVKDRGQYLWGNAAYAFGAVLIRAFCESGWMAELRGFQRDQMTGGLVSGIPVQPFATDRPGVAHKFPLEVAVSDLREKELADLGFVPLCHCKDTDYSVFYSNQSVQKPRTYDTVSATTNARISAMLQYMLCASRFAHYLKVRARDRIGSFMEEGALEDDLRNWLQQYVANDENASPGVRAKYPLREAEVKVTPDPGKPGSYQCVMHLLPHSQLDALTVGIKLRTELAAAQAR